MRRLAIAIREEQLLSAEGSACVGGGTDQLRDMILSARSAL